MAAGTTIKCTSCHDWHDASYYVLSGANIVWAKVNAVGRNNETCDTCHENRATLHATGTAHNNRVIDSSCSQCHTSDTSVLGHPGTGTLETAADVDTLHRSDCTLCHAYTGTKIDAAIVAQAIQAGLNGIQISCNACHSAHPAIDHTTLVTVGTTSCGNCHSDPPPLTDAADPKVHNDCTSCHDANFNTISLAAGKTFAAGGDCTTCHTDPFTAIHPETVDHSGIVTTTGTSCGSCHTSTALVDPADPKVHNACSTCHDANGGLISLAAGKSAPGNCNSCHGADFTTIHPATVDHSALVTVGTTICASCHSDPPPLVDATDPKVHNACASCHDTDGTLINLAVGKSFAVGGDCATCHGAGYFEQHVHDHGATVTGTPDCVSCHQHNDSDIIGVIHKNTCASCHGSADPVVINAINAGQAECIDCHAAHDGPAIHENLGAPETCSTCHTDKINGTDFAYIINYHGPLAILGYTELDRCQRCHNSILPEVVNTINAGKGASGIPVDCQDCHMTQHVAITTPSAIHSEYILVNAGETCGDCHLPDNSTHTDMGATASCGTCHLSTSQDEINVLHQNDCLVCHLSTRSEVVAAINTGISGSPVKCATCHSEYEADFFGAHQNPDHTGIVTVTGTSCANCHSNTLVDATDPKVHNACSTCHDANGALISLATGKSAPGNCNSCHGADFTTIHPATVDHTALVTVGSTSCASCHSDPPPLVDATDPKVHNACASCHDTNGALISLAAGKSFAVGGDCATCHGNHFPNHNHHSGVNNDVSYNAAVDTSQTSQQGCAVCHHDFDTVNGTSLDLSTWETILVEHDLDGTKDGSTNTCDNCHAYDGGSSAPLTAVQNAIASGNPATCATCHTDKVPDVDHGVPTSGKHSEHLVMTGVSCATCHNTGDFPYFKSGTDLDGDNLYNLTETDVCDTCHQDATGNPAAGFKDGWYDPGFVLDCSSCHAATPATGSHTSHLSLTDCGNCHDGTVPDTTAPVQHLDGNIDVYDITPSDLGYPADKAIGSEYAPCSNTYCHSTAQGVTNPTDPPTYVASPAWGTPFGGTEATCTGCHNSGGHVGDASSPLTTGSHAKHLNFLFDQDATCNACHFDWSYTDCSTCHQRQINHVDNSIDVMFKPDFPLSATSSSGVYTGDPAPRTPYGSCSALYCHSPGTKASAPYDDPNMTTLVWGNSGMPADCTGCHDGDITAAQPMATGSHGTHITNYDCSKCHARTVENSRSLNTTIYPAKNYTYGQRYHVDGWVTVAFSSDIATSGAYAGAASPTVYRAPGSAAGSCDNTYCHSDGSSVSTNVIPDNTTLDWGTGALSCDGCHSYPPAYDSGTPKANSHAAHSSYSCDTCHFSTTATGDTITNTANHANQTYDVQAGSGVSFVYSFDSAGGTCSSISCHGGSGAAWGDSMDHSTIVTVGTTGCASCHSDPPPLVDATDPKVHNACASCHDANGGLISLAAGQTSPGDCATCHGTDFPSIHPTTTDHSGIVTTAGTNCGTCHTSTALVDPADPKVHNACSTCHDANGGLVSLAAGKSAPGNCNSCHGADFTTIHPATVDHTALVTVGTTSCASCHSDPPPLTDATDPKVHDACTSCHDTNGGLVSLAAGKSFAVGGDCATCHGADFTSVHPDTVDHSQAIQSSTGCGDCHTSTALVDPADPKVHNDCSTCHDTNGGLISLAAGNTSPNECITCHGTNFTNIHLSPPSHNPPVSVSGTTNCSDCHNNTLVSADVTTHDSCTSCHGGTNGVITPGSRADGITLGVPGQNCETCHTEGFDSVHAAHAHTVEVGPNDLSYDPPGQPCSDCHVVANWSEIEGVEHNVSTNGAGSCSTCHNSPRAEVQSAISAGANPTYCLVCHSDKELTPHGDVDHRAAGLVTVGGTQDYYNTTCASCHDPGGSVDTIAVTHKDNCSLCHTSVPNLQPGLSPGNCVNCHTTYEHTLWTRYMDTCATSACHPSFDGGPGGSQHDAHTAGWAAYPADYPSSMWVTDFPLSPDCSTCHKSPTDSTRGQGCSTCHTFEGKGDTHLRHSDRASKGGLEINCSACHWNS